LLFCFWEDTTHILGSQARQSVFNFQSFQVKESFLLITVWHTREHVKPHARSTPLLGVQFIHRTLLA
jgi:hypothetical protein